MNVHANSVESRIESAKQSPRSSSRGGVGRLRRQEYYICLCGKCLSKCNCDHNGCNCVTNGFCGFPFYIWCFSIILSLGMAAAITWLVYTSWQLSVTNNSYAAGCTSNGDCNTLSGLYCPDSNTTSRCACPTGKFWNGTNCTNLLNINDTGCYYDFQCDPSKNLVCLSGQCTCPPPRQWISSVTMCLYNYKGCFNDGSGTTLLYTENNNKLNNFVEACCNSCYINSYIYALIQRNSGSGGSNECKCQNSTPVSIQVSNCNNHLCYSYTSPYGLPCGDMNYGNRAAYQLR